MNSSLIETAEAGSAPAVDVGDADYLKRINAARVYDVAIETPLVAAEQLSARIGNRLFLKREDLQPVHSFKLRGAYNKISQLTAAERERGVICASAGNHAQGVALAGRNMGIRAVIVMPRTTPAIKVRAVAGFGGEIVLHGDGYDDAAAHAAELQERDGLVYIHPYDDPDVIAGQGTIGMEIVRQHPQDIHAVFVCVGGGGLLAGVAAYIKSVRPEIRVIGVEPEDAASMGAALAAGERVTLKEVGLFADGVAVKRAGAEPFRLCAKHVDAMMTVSVDEICAAVRDIYEDTRALAEPAGALAVAGAKKYAAETGIEDQHLVAITSGANVNFDRLSYIAERAELGEQREALLAVTIPERPGSFRQFCEVIGDRSISEFNYRYADHARAQVFAGVKLSNGTAERDTMIADLEAAGYAVLDMSRNEMAKLHVRHMVGGRARGVGDEVLFRVEFPERPGALRRFLEAVGDRWNISLFHYRNHGHAHGLVLVGMQVAPTEQGDCRAALDALGYDYAEETGNPAYQMFLHNND
ncbi:threonine ammonia-lyase, biosynthetic [Salinisphaera orenii]|uniref:L-threonine dehydratase n=1 Tax=Salinisphaera orenii YIM 95161 TaxID=1051139 RepID=A0A423PYL5_9GAMM|nr:threonine ammonia-lyase, biosynthetic [Salinisphaera halophila]ROO30696.1 L-threonine dehydratase biosynthetic IlvA [Salinisphaera halophila YIM 95161]